MKHSHAMRRRSLVAQPSAFKLSPVAAACAAMMFVASSASAQQAAQPAPDNSAQPSNVITVTGIRRGIEDAISTKKNSDMIVETISSEDLGKLPDDSIADALSTLPGVAAQIIGGRSATLNIRGLSGDFVNTLFNGREQASVGDNRAVMYDQYPAELISAASVYKTPDAELIGQGLAATVDLKTLLPLDYSTRVLQFKAMGESASLGKLNPEVNDHGDRLSASYIDQFADRTIGVAIGWAHLDSPVEDQMQKTWGYGPAGAPGAATAQSIGGGEWWSTSSASVRDGLMGVVQWKPNRDFSSVVDTYYSRSSENDNNRGIQGGTSYTTITNPGVNNGFLTSGSGVGLGGSGGPVVRNDFNTENDRIFSIGWKNTYRAGDWTFVGDLSGSNASAKQQILETYSGAFKPVTFNFNANPFSGMSLTNSSFNFANPGSVQLGDPGGWGQDGYDKFPAVTDKVKELRLSAKRDLGDGIFSSFVVGGNITDREKTRVAPEYFVDFASGYASGKTSPIPGNLITGPVSLPNGPTITGISPLGLLDSGLYKLVNNAGNADVYAKNWEVDEKISTLYGQLNIDTTIGSIPLRGNLGLQLVHSNQSSDAIESNGAGTGAATSGGASYNNWLPSLNLVASLPDDQQLRFGLAQELQRPRFDDMNASNEASLSASTRLWSSTTGNPDLRPTLANAIDLSYEKYFGKKGYIAVAPYYKYLKTYIYQEAETFNYSGIPTNGVVPISNIGTATEYVNGTGGSEKGIEFTINIPFDLLTPALEGFGAEANAARGSSSIQTSMYGQTSQSALPGFSSSVANMVLYYENNGFSARFRESYRSSYLGEVQGFGANLAYSNFLGVHTDDVQLSYEFKSGPLKGLTGLFQVLNINNPTITQTYGVGQGMSETDRYGRTYLLGVNYKL